MPKHICPNNIPDNHPDNSGEIPGGNRRGKKSIIRTRKSHNQISKQKISLRHRNIMILILLRINKIKHCWRSLHSEKSPHQSTDTPSNNLHWLSRPHFNTFTEKYKIDTHHDQCDTQQNIQNTILHPLQHKHRPNRHDHKSQQNRQEPIPNNVSPLLHYNDKGSCHSQNTRKRRSLSIRPENSRQHRHNEDTKSKTGRPLHETSPNTQYE